MWFLRVIIVCVAFAAAPSALAADPAEAPPPQRLSRLYAKLDFAPMWIPVPKFQADPSAENIVPSASYAIVWQPLWQKEIHLSAAQKEKLLAISAKTANETKKQTERFERLSAEEQTAEANSWGGKSAPWREQLDKHIREGIEATLTPEQLQMLREFSFPIVAVSLLYDPQVRCEFAVSSEQEDRFRRVVREKLAKAQEVSLRRAEQVWSLLTPAQQAKLPEIVKRHGPTSKILSLAYQSGFDRDAMGLSYPMLAQQPVRERLKLDADQQKQLQAVLADAAAKSRKTLPGAPQPDSEPDDKRQVEAILTPGQLKALHEIDFHREVDLVLGYPETRAKLSMTEQQQAQFHQLDKNTHEQLYRIDRHMLAKALAVLSPSQIAQLRTEIDRRGAW